jgi:hypothetical protein
VAQKPVFSLLSRFFSKESSPDGKIVGKLNKKRVSLTLNGYRSEKTVEALLCGKVPHTFHSFVGWGK